MPLVILVSGHEANIEWIGLTHSTFDMDIIMLDHLLVIIFVFVECAMTPQFVQLTNTLTYLQKLHCIMVDKAHLLILNFKPIMK
jgi:hypothetical protein